MDKIIIKGMDIFAYHGVLDEERNWDNTLFLTLKCIII